MSLIPYSSSDDSDSVGSGTPPAKKRKLSRPHVVNREGEPAAVLVPSVQSAAQVAGSDRSNSSLPALPASFHDLYTSTVRSSTSDDPSLHGGRKRVTPHVDGNWAGHVYVEWRPPADEVRTLAELLSRTQDMTSRQIEIHSLLNNELEVQLPLHVSLSRPLVLRSDSKDRFLFAIKAAIAFSGVRTCVVQPRALRWHPNETRTRWFLVLQLEDSPNRELERLLRVCNEVARMSGQPELYADPQRSNRAPGSRGLNRIGDCEGGFHVSLAWSLTNPEAVPSSRRSGEQDEILLASSVRELMIPVDSVKIRLGQDVSTVDLAVARGTLISP